MVVITSYKTLNYDTIPLDADWNEGNLKEYLMHTIHAYPAKFPAFIASKAFDYAQEEGVEIKKVADVFCGCGTVALEAKLHNYDFWGCDINPVATLIAKTKSNDYEVDKIKRYYTKIEKAYEENRMDNHVYEKAGERLQYWFKEESYCSLYKIYQAICDLIDEIKYQEAFKCIFSSILKASSRWLTKSIKPQIDPEKQEIDVFRRFKTQYNKFLNAIEEICYEESETDITCGNFLALKELPKVDLIVTSPPYVTSYEYADLHQLSSLWLKYTDDYRKLRKGSIGSIYNSEDFFLNMDNLNQTGKMIVKELQKNNKSKTKVKAIARYYSDIQKVIEKSKHMLNNGGMIFFVVGDTEYKGVKIQNSKHLIEAMELNGYKNIKISKRTISKGLCVPYRDEKGKFSTDKTKREVYHEEFIISGRIYDE